MFLRGVFAGGAIALATVMVARAAEPLTPFENERLVHALKDPAPLVVRSAVRFLSEHPTVSPAAITRLASIVQTETDEELRLNALAALERAAAAAGPAVSVIAEVLAENNPKLRRAALKTLAAIGPSAASSASKVLPLVTDPPSIRAALEALGAFRTLDSATVQTLRELLVAGRLQGKFAPLARLDSWESFYPDVLDRIRQGAAADRVAALEFLWQRKRLDDETVLVATLLDDPEPEVRVAAFEAFRFARNVASVPVARILDLTESPEPKVQDAALSVAAFWAPTSDRLIQAQASRLTSHDFGVRMNGVYRLGLMGRRGGAVVPILRSVLADPDSGVRGSAVDELAKLAPSLTVEAYDSLNLAPDDQGRFLGRLETPALEDPNWLARVVRYVGEENSREIRVSAIATLGRLRAAGQEPLFLRALFDRDSVVRVASLRALRNLDDSAEKMRSLIEAELLKPSVSQFPEPLAALVLLDPRPDFRAVFGPALWEQLTFQFPGWPKNIDRELSRMRDRENLDVVVSEFTQDHAIGMASSLLRRFDGVNSALPVTLYYLNEAARTTGEYNILNAYLVTPPSAFHLAVIRLLGGRSPGGRLMVTPGDARTLLPELEKMWPQTADLPALRAELAEILATLARQGDWSTLDLPLLYSIRSDLRTAKFLSPAASLTETIDGDAQLRWLRRGLGLFGGHALFWILLIWAYPYSRSVQAFFFWNKWPRRLFGFGYVGIALTHVPFLRRRLLAPFRDQLVPPGTSTETQWFFAGLEIVSGSDRQPALQALASWSGRLLLEAPSGAGKTTLLLTLARQSPRLAVYLRAVDCGPTVVAGIQRKLLGQARDEVFLRTLIYAGALDVYIDGLNEAPPDVRSGVARFVEELFRGNFLISTQPLRWEPPPGTRRFALQPLRRDQLVTFLQQQWARVAPHAAIKQQDYTVRLAQLMGSLGLDPTPDTVSLLSNAFDASLAADLLARGESPDARGIVAQAAALMRAEFRRQHQTEFRSGAFAEALYEWKISGAPDFTITGFEREAVLLKEFRLMLHRMETTGSAHQPETGDRWVFRHEVVANYFLAPAFLPPHTDRRPLHLGDPRFVGLFEILALTLPVRDVEELQQQLLDWSAEHNDHEMLDRFVLRLRFRRSVVGSSPGAVAASST